jgi:hypothetical protein
MAGGLLNRVPATCRANVELSVKAGDTGRGIPQPGAIVSISYEEANRSMSHRDSLQQSFLEA